MGRLALSAGVLFLFLACARQAEPGNAGPSDPNVLTNSQLGTFANARLAIQTLRPEWLRARAAGNLQGQGQVWVYRDGMRFGGLDRLSAINTVEIDSIRYYDGITASQRWGLGHENGVIHVTSKVR